jgi:Tol biopolymer transport system component
MILAVAAAVLTASGAGVARATYPGSNNGRITFAMNVGGNVDVYSALANGNDVRRLTDDPSFEACPTYSATAHEIAYCSGQNGPFEIWVMKQNGKEPHQVTHLNARSLFPDYSPDGSKIALSASGVGGDAKSEIFIVNADDPGSSS